MLLSRAGREFLGLADALQGREWTSSAGSPLVVALGLRGCSRTILSSVYSHSLSLPLPMPLPLPLLPLALSLPRLFPPLSLSTCLPPPPSFTTPHFTPPSKCQLPSHIRCHRHTQSPQRRPPALVDKTRRAVFATEWEERASARGSKSTEFWAISFRWLYPRSSVAPVQCTKYFPLSLRTMPLKY